jgi:hypothetical protein
LSTVGRSAGRPLPATSCGVLGPARQRRRRAARLGHLAHSRHLLATTTTCFSFVSNFVRFCNM